MIIIVNRKIYKLIYVYIYTYTYIIVLYIYFTSNYYFYLNLKNTFPPFLNKYI